MTDFAAARTKMVDSQLRTEGVTDPDILSVMGTVPREAFVPPAQKAFAYIDESIRLDATAGDRFLMRPAAFARLVEAAEIGSSDIVLDVGCGSGYSAAVLGGLANSVVALEVDPKLAASAAETLAALDVTNAAVVTAPLSPGYPSEGPYDVIVLEGSAEVVPEALLAQLKEGGRLVAVVGQGRSALATVFTKTDGDIGRRIAFDAWVPPLPGFAREKAFVF